MEGSAHNHNHRRHSNKLFSGGQNGYCSGSDDSDGDPDGNLSRHCEEDEDIMNQYERIGDRTSGTSTGSSGLSHHHHQQQQQQQNQQQQQHPTQQPPKATHYAESAIYKRSRGYPSPDSEAATLPASYVPQPATQYLLNRVGVGVGSGVNSGEPWSQSSAGCHTLERNIDSNSKNNNKIISNNLLSSSVHHLLSSSMAPDNINTSCGPLIDTQRGGEYDSATTCLVRTQSGSLFIPSDGHKGIVGNPLQGGNDFDALVSGHHHHHHTMAPIIKSDTGKSINAERPPILSSNHLPLIPGRIGSRGGPISVRKTLSSHCSWKCTAITFMLLSVALLIAVCYFMGIFLSGDSDGHHVCPVMMVETELNPESSERKTPVASRIRGRREPSSQHVHDSDNDDSDGGRDKDDINEDAIVKEDPSFTSSFSSPLTPSSGEVHGLHVSQTETSTKSTLSPIAGEISDAWAPVVHERSSSEEDRVLAHNDNGGSTSVDLNTNSGKDFFVVMHAPSVPSPSSSSSVKTQTNTVPKTNPSSAALISQRLHEENNPTKLLPDDNYLNPKAVNPVINTNDLSSNGGRRRESSESQSLDGDGHVESKQGDDYSNDDRVGRGNSDESSHLLSSQENAGDTEKGKEEDIGQEAKSGTVIDPKETKGVNDANRLPVSTSSGSGYKLIGSKNWHSNDSGSLQLTEKLNQPGIELGESFRQRTSSQGQTLHQQDKHFSSNDDREKQMQKDVINASRTDSVALKAEDELLITTVISDNLGGAVEDVIDTKEMRTETQVETKQYLLENNDQKSLDFIESTVDPRLEERGMNSEKTISKDENDGVKARDADGSRLKTTDGPDGLKYTEGTEIFSTISSMDLDRTDNSRIRNENNDNGKMDDVWLNPLSAAPSMKDESSSLQTLQDDPSSFVTTSNFNFETNNNNFLIKSNSGPKTVVSNNVNPSAVGDGRKLEEAKFMEIELGKKHTQRVPSYGHWNVQLFQTEPTLVKFNYTIPVGVSVGIYGGKNRIPSHTKYDFMEVIGSGTGPARASRSNSLASNYGLPPSRKVQVSEFIQFLDKGTWYIVMYNDASQPQEISFITLVADESNMRCPYSCSGHGNCVMGTCKCDVDYTGDACEYRVCPILCSGRGKYNKGQCVCNTGWKGKECELREDECEVSDCSGHGDCVDGICHCFPGYKGQHCEEVDCLDPDCSNHGTCVNGLCLCGKGWKGAHCNEPDSNALRCLPDCSGHGSFDLDLQQCICDSRWTGTDCSQERCDLDCGPNGHCQSNECVCAQGWTGPKCEERFCDPRCLEHGQCKNGTCLCHQGWNGKHCTLEGCPRSCNNKGECVGGDNEWECECNPNWAGHDCSIPLEKDCSDKKDNDNDGLIDCADSECCGSKECQNNPLCFSSADPLDILLRKQPPSPTASFFQRMQFLIEEDSVQSYAHKQAFNDSMFWTRFNSSRASVIRGQVKSPSGSGLMGVRVGIASEPLLGFVVSRETGWFDIMVNGGSAVTLHFQREPFRPTQRTVMVPWNEIVVIDKVKMNVDERKLPDYRSPICVEHDYDLMRPVILGAWKHGFQGGCNDEKGHVSESTVVQESIQIPASNVHLVYHSSRAGGYLSTFDMQLTPDKVPPSLRQIHVKIAIEGNLFEKTFEGDPNIKFTYAWNRRNVYRQKVYGIATALVHVGYEYLNCPQVIWEVQSVKLGGHDMSISEIGGWNLNVHHRFNFHEGILQKGDGENVYLKNKPKVMKVIMGDGQQRPLHCPYCNGLAKEQRLLAPVALASGPDGSIYVGDFNLVRRLSPDGKVSTIIELSASQVAYKYHLTVGPVDGKLYISDPERHQVLRAITLIDPIVNPRNNLEVVVGSGVKCLPGNKNLCGDGRLARDARLAYPKGIAISLNNEMFIADGTNIRMVDSSGLIHTLIGDHYHKSHWKPFPCKGTIPIQKVNLRWPTELAISPLDNSLHILDDHMVLKLTPDKRIRIIAGRPTHCSSVITAQEEISVKEQESVPATQIFLETPQSITFSPNGDLFIAESDSQMINRVRVVSNNGKIHKYAGVDLKCSCMEINCECFNEDNTFALSSKLSTVSSITVTPDGRLHICDQGNLRIRSVLSVMPSVNKNQEYEIESDSSDQVYVFNRFGQHIVTKEKLNGKPVYSFTYVDNTSSGKLSAITDASGNKIFLLRDYSNQVKTIESAQGGQCRLSMSRMKMLHTFMSPGTEKVTFNYYGSTGLLKSRTDANDQSVIYNYDEYGRLTQAVTPSGAEVALKSSLSLDGPCVRVVKRADSKDEVKPEATSEANVTVMEVTASRQRRVASSNIEYYN